MKDDAENSKKQRVVGRPFPPGVSGNPGGRPKGISLAGVLAANLTEDDAKMIVQAIVEAAKNGDVKAFAALIDRTDGKVPNVLTGGEDADGNEKPIPLRIVSE